MKKVVFFLVIICAGCASFSGMNKRQFHSDLDDKKEIILRVPKGYEEELVRAEAGKRSEQYYTYGNDALLYVGYKADWQSPNFPMTEASRQKNVGQNETIYNGRDPEGRYWKEVQVDSLRFGYCKVPAADKDRFEQAVNSVRHKRKPFWKNHY
jgi:hypothetical protein